MHSFTEENYLKAIYKLIEHNGDPVTTNAIAERMNTKAASVTDMLKKLADKKLIHYQKYQGVTLSDKGEKVALSIIRKHRLWEMFLVETFDFKWDEVHEVAEQLEHINSDKLVEQLDKFLNYPKTDPHGDPIPDANGKLKLNKSTLLSELNMADTGIIVGVVDHSPAFLRFLDSFDISLKDQITIKNIIEFDHSLEITVNRKRTVFISNHIAKNLLVQKQNSKSVKAKVKQY
ncbi:MAG TPA: metal-dependent transcriptional regulator [Bacteroidia bacterium]|jgi:DtxR family Mn-dependent transcriptional regulator|nr:metal-dependent transcriptional regulator [Bacteroidia bacterium]HRG52846.1 metal-dependent transcriptional regulator [Bacteroidia bacterium]